ncbi:uncharacterized protein FFE2_00002 [Fusarium fujikuroi]|nr:uncharacterized protein FFE2_00002 [Fusarium fujikuroi]
MARDTGKIL